MPKRKYTVEDWLETVRWSRMYKDLKYREGKHYLKELRRERGLTQKRLAERAGVSQQFVSRIESNWVNVGPKTVRRLASALEMDPLELTLIEVIYRDSDLRTVRLIRWVRAECHRSRGPYQERAEALACRTVPTVPLRQRADD